MVGKAEGTREGRCLDDPEGNMDVEAQVPNKGMVRYPGFPASLFHKSTKVSVSSKAY